MKKVFSVFLSLVLACTTLLALPLSARAGMVELSLERNSYHFELEWNQLEGDYVFKLYRAEKQDLSDAQCIETTDTSEYTTTIENPTPRHTYYDYDVDTRKNYYYYVELYRVTYSLMHYYDEDGYDWWSYAVNEWFYVENSNVVSGFIADETHNITPYLYSDKSVVSVEWDYYSDDVDGFMIYRSKNKGKFEKIKTVATNKDSQYYYKDKKATGFNNYRYVVVPYYEVDGVKYYSKEFSKNSKEYVPFINDLELTTKSKSEIVKWKKIKGAATYKLYMTSTSKPKLVATIKNGKTSTTVKNLNNSKKYYSFQLKAYNSKGVLIGTSFEAYSTADDALFRAAKRTKNRSSYDVINVQGKKTKKAWTGSVSKADKKIFDDFAKKHFKKDWSDYQKAKYTLEWINKNVKYASGSKYSKISSCSYVDAIFNKKLGQCVQYNGAYVAFLNYLGYDARLVQGWRGYSATNKWQHFWGEINIDGTWMLMETGNYDNDGYWQYFCTPYSQSSGYLINLKPAK